MKVPRGQEHIVNVIHSEKRCTAGVLSMLQACVIVNTIQIDSALITSHTMYSTY